MPNERLRDALLRHGLGLDQVARATSVDPKTVERWISKGRLPYPKHRRAIAAMVRESENYLWPDAIAPERKAEIGRVFDKVSEDLTHGYLLSFQPPPVENPAWRPIQVTVGGPRGLKVRAREGYYPE